MTPEPLPAASRFHDRFRRMEALANLGLGRLRLQVSGKKPGGTVDDRSRLRCPRPSERRAAPKPGAHGRLADGLTWDAPIQVTAAAYARVGAGRQRIFARRMAA